VSSQEIDGWRAAARSMLVPYDEKLAVHPQAEGFTRHEIWDFAGTSPEQYR
jgi:alpha,alpha-trehalose phosphorylase